MSQAPSSVWTRSTKANDRPSASRKPRPAVSTTITVMPGLVISQKSARRAEMGRDGSSTLSVFEIASMKARGEPAAEGVRRGKSSANGWGIARRVRYGYGCYDRRAGALLDRGIRGYQGGRQGAAPSDWSPSAVVGVRFTERARSRASLG